MVISPIGEIVLELDDREQAAVVDVDEEAIQAARSHFRFLDDVRPDLFPDLFEAVSPTATA